MKALEPCKVVVFGGIREFRLKLKSLGIDKILNDDESIKESDVVLIVIDKVNGKLVAVRGDDISTFNSLDLKMFTGYEIKEIVHISTDQSLEDFKFDTNKIYYVKSFDNEENEYWLFKPKEEKQEKLTACTVCLNLLNGEVDYGDDTPGTVMDNSEITELREATPSEIKIFLNTVKQWKKFRIKDFLVVVVCIGFIYYLLKERFKELIHGKFRFKRNIKRCSKRN